MKKSVHLLLSLFLSWVILFILAKLCFMLCYRPMYAGIGFTDILLVIWHGLKMDLATAGYLSAIPGLMLVAGPWFRSPRPVIISIKIYLAIISLLVLTIIGVDTALYGYWDFKLDITPLFYIMTDPVAAVASAPLWMVISGIILLALLAITLYMLLVRVTGLKKYDVDSNLRLKVSGTMLLLTALLFIPIRGGFGVATVNMSTAFYSNNMRLNHAAVNPAFSLFYSAMHQQAFNKMFRLIEPDQATKLLDEVTESKPYAATQLLNTEHPDIYIIILESFSNSLFPSLGGEPIANGLDSIARDGLVMTDFYSSTFRTDRAIPAILNAFPAQPTTSLSKYPEKTRHIPSLARSMSSAGYPTYYYYGGDATFANKQTFLLNTGFERVITLKDFGNATETSKWGVPDGVLFERALYDAQADTASSAFRVIQTLSSHEPFEVPYHNPAFASDEACNAFAYTDSCATAFIDRLAASPRWDRTLVILVPDHYGCYPHNPDPADVILRHRIPLIMTGGALAIRGPIDTPASQVDITATLLDAMGIDRSEYKFSRNFLDPAVKPFAFMSTPTYTATVDSNGVSSVYNIETRLFNTGTEHPVTHADSINAAYLQTLYDTLNDI